MVFWVNGQLVDRNELVLRPDDHALVGDGVFEAIKLIGGKPFALTRHLDRLAASAVPLDLPVDLAAVRAAVAEILTTEQAQVSPSWLRVTVTGGSAAMGTAGVGTSPTIIAAIAPMAAWGPSCNVVIAPWTRNEGGATAGLKTISYAENVIATRYAHRNHADDAIFANTKGMLCEGTGSNVFVVYEGRLCTPSPASGCLAGVTQRLLLDWMPEIEVRDVPIEALANAEEAFLTSTSRDVHPIATVDGKPLKAAPGPLTQKAMEVWAANFAAEIGR
ncbi:MAG: aminotransferase class IV [Actinomycetia bacterium]|nr:aminotransferase class IV [Actinomycetes bacterium]